MEIGPREILWPVLSHILHQLDCHGVQKESSASPPYTLSNTVLQAAHLFSLTHACDPGLCSAVALPIFLMTSMNALAGGAPVPFPYEHTTFTLVARCWWLGGQVRYEIALNSCGPKEDWVV